MNGVPKLLFIGGFSWTESLRAVLSPGCLWKAASRLPWSEGTPLSLVFTENLLVLSLCQAPQGKDNCAMVCVVGGLR